MKKRGLSSPDLADALAMTFAAEMATLPTSRERGRGDHLVVEPLCGISQDQPFLPAWDVFWSH